MKKFFLISALCLIAFGVFGQNQGKFNGIASLKATTVDGDYFTTTEGTYVPSTTPIVLAPQEQVIGKTKYDAQSNGAIASRFYRFPDGRMVATWTGGHQNPSATGFPDRGSFYNYFNGTTWTSNPDNIVRIENERTGWPSWAPLGNGEILVSHTSSTVCLWARETVGTGEWTKKSTLTGANIWARVCVNDGVIHLITTISTADPNFPLYYSKSTDGGATWNPERVKLSTILPDYDYSDFSYGVESYVWAEPNNGMIALSLSGSQGDLVVYKSADNGINWEKKIAWETPYKNVSYPFIEDIPAPSKTHSLIIDDDGVCHIAFIGCETPGGAYSVRNISRALYWNETLEPFSAPNQAEALDPELNPQLEKEDRLILNLSFVGDEFAYSESKGPMVMYTPFGMIHKINMALAGPNRLIIVLAVQDHENIDPKTNFYFSGIFACSYVKEGDIWILDKDWSHDLDSWGFPGWLRIDKEAHYNENCTFPQIVIEKTDDDTGKFHIFFMVDDMPGGGLEGASDGSNNPQKDKWTDNYFVVYSDFVNFIGPPSDPPVITTSSLPNGLEGTAYNQTLTATGTPPITWSLTKGELPLGLTLNAETGRITGTPTEKHILYEFDVTATNEFGSDTKPLSIFIDSIVVGITTIDKSPILVYPNPAFDILHVVNKNQNDMSISLFDFLGREVITKKTSETAEIDVSKLPAGVYNIRIQYANTVETKKIVKR